MCGANPFAFLAVVVELWYIPTSVGLTDPRGWRDTAPAVHPHVRGANRVRGAVGETGDRFIPTCVGLIAHLGRLSLVAKRFIPTCVGLMVQEGANEVEVEYGSSPRAWG